MNTTSNIPVHYAAPLIGLVVMLAATAPSIAAAVPPLLHETKTVKIDASVSKVWVVTGSFTDLTWVPAVKTSSATAGNTPGSHRTLDFGGAQMTETLVKYNAATHSYTYKIDNTDVNHKIAPVSDVTSTISVKPTAGGSILTWTGTFHRLDHRAMPAAGADDAAAQKQIAAVFSMGVAGAKTRVEAQ